jgi:hypothetical protein
MLELQRNLYRTVFAFVSVAAGMAVLYWAKPLDSTPNLGRAVLFSLSQVQVLLALFAVSLYGAQTVVGGYIAALEEQINAECKARTSIWESVLAPQYLLIPRSAAAAGVWAVGLFFLAYFVLFLALGLGLMRGIYVRIAMVVEVLVILCLVIWAHLDARRVRRFASRYLAEGAAAKPVSPND